MKLLRYYYVCHKIMCTECSISLQHRQHSKKNLVEAINEAKRSTESLLNDSTQIIDVFKDSLKQSVQTITKIQTKSDTVNN